MCWVTYVMFHFLQKPMMLSRMWRTFCSRQSNFLPNYVVYHYLRSKGWVPKAGAKYGADFGMYYENYLLIGQQDYCMINYTNMYKFVIQWCQSLITFIRSRRHYVLILSVIIDLWDKCHAIEFCRPDHDQTDHNNKSMGC